MPRIWRRGFSVRVVRGTGGSVRGGKRWEVGRGARGTGKQTQGAFEAKSTKRNHILTAPSRHCTTTAHCTPLSPVKLG